MPACRTLMFDAKQFYIGRPWERFRDLEQAFLCARRISVLNLLARSFLIGFARGELLHGDPRNRSPGALLPEQGSDQRGSAAVPPFRCSWNATEYERANVEMVYTT